jgi:CRISPR-associated exonuclease Cas4
VNSGIAHYSDDDLLSLSGLQHFAFCERQWALIHVEQAWEDSADTLRGSWFHERVDTVGYSCADGVRSERAVSLVSHELGLYGIADIVESLENDSLQLWPVEYKVGAPKLEDWDRIQLGAQAMCLEEMSGTSIAVGYLFYGETRRREKVEIDEGLRTRVRSLSAKAHELFDLGLTPPPDRKARCKRCSLKNICLPEAFQNDVSRYWMSFGESLGD